MSSTVRCLENTNNFAVPKYFSLHFRITRSMFDSRCRINCAIVPQLFHFIMLFVFLRSMDSLIIVQLSEHSPEKKCSCQTFLVMMLQINLPKCFNYSWIWFLTVLIFALPNLENRPSLLLHAMFENIIF